MDKKIAYNNIMRLYGMLSEEYKQSLDEFLVDYEKSASSTSIPSYNEIRDGQEFYGNGYKKGYKDAKQEFERPKGEWLFKNGKYRCSHCGEKAIYRFSGSCSITQTELLTDFCWKCGAEMRDNKNGK